MTDRELSMIRALAAIDDALGMPQDGCNSTAKTLTAIKLLNAIIKDDQLHIQKLEAAATTTPQPALSLTHEMIDTAYRKVWSTVTHRERLAAFAYEIEAAITGRKQRQRSDR